MQSARKGLEASIRVDVAAAPENPRLLQARTLLCDTSIVTGAEFLRRVKRLAERTGREMRFVAARGKGSHGRLYLDSAFTTV